MSRLGSHLRSNAVAYVALFVALGGAGAWAAATIGPGDIKRDAVRAKHIKSGHVRSAELAEDAVRSRHARLVEHASAAAEITTGFLDGPPQIILTPPSGSLIGVYASVQGKRVTTNLPEPCEVLLLEDPEPFEVLSGGIALVEFSSTSYTRKLTTVNSAAGTSGERGSWIVFPPDEPGVRTRYSLRYENRVGDTCAFRNRELWLQVIR